MERRILDVVASFLMVLSVVALGLTILMPTAKDIGLCGLIAFLWVLYFQTR